MKECQHKCLEDHPVSNDPNLDETSLVNPILSVGLIDSGQFPIPASIAGDDRATTRTHRIGKTHVLVITQDSRVQQTVRELELGQGGIGSYKITLAVDVPKAMVLLKDPGWHCYLFDESSYAILSFLNDTDRLRVQRSSVVLMDLQPVGEAAMTSAECLPRSRISKFALDNAFARIVRHHQSKVARIAERETIHDILWRLARGNLVNHQDVNSALRPLVEAAVKSLHVGKASVWQFMENPKRLRCLSLYDAASGEHHSGIEVPANLCPVYCTSLASHRIMAIDDALSDPRSQELGDIYLKQAGIGALLDAPIYLDGVVVGLFCCAHVGGPRQWSENEQHIAASFGDYAQLVLLTHQRQAAEGTMAAQRVRLAQAMKMETIGLFAGRITNDFTDILTSISCRAQSLIAREGKNNPDLTHEFHQIVALCQRGTTRVSQLAAFARPAMATLTPVSLNDVAREVAALIQCMGRAGIRIIQNARAKPDAIMGDAIEIQRAIFNAVTNSIDAMQDAGTVELSTVNTLKEVELTIRDTAKSHAHVAGVSIGLLEAICKQHGGKIWVESKNGDGKDGNTIHLSFPMAGSTGESAGWPSSQVKPVTIFIIDDSRSRWQQTEEALGFFGYRIEFKSPSEALKAMGASRNSKNIVIISLDLASMNAVECYRAIKLIDCHVRSVIVGDEQDKRAGAFSGNGAVLLPRSFTISAMLKTIEGMIE
jgi:signal transduction histidine kinase